MRNLKSATPARRRRRARHHGVHASPPDDAAKPGSAAADARRDHRRHGERHEDQPARCSTRSCRPSPASPPPKRRKEQRDALLEQLVNMTLAAQAAEKDGLAQGSGGAGAHRPASHADPRRSRQREVREGSPGLRRRGESRVRHAGREDAEGIQGTAHPGRDEGRCERRSSRTSQARRRLRQDCEGAVEGSGQRRRMAATSAGSPASRWSSRSPTRSRRSKRVRPPRRLSRRSTAGT